MEGNAMVSLGDAMLLGQRNGGYGGCDGMAAWMNNPFFYLIFLAFFGNGGYCGYGGGNGALTRAELQMGLDNQDIKAGIRGIQQGICDGFYANNTTMLQGFNGIQRDLCAGFSSVTAGLNQLGYQQQQCCCEVKGAIHAEGEATRALITENIIQGLRDRIVAKDQELQTANFQLSQQAQSAALINALRPTPVPAYITCSPFTTGYSGCGGYGGCGAN
jgi:hypothetical protein